MHEAAEGKALAIVAGAGALPIEAARLLAARDRGVVAVAFEGLSDPELASVVAEIRWLRLGQLDPLAEALSEMGVRDLLLIGKVPKSLLFDASGRVAPDAAALRLLAEAPQRGDESLMAAFAGWLEKRGLHCVDQAECLAPLLVAEGPLGAHAATAPPPHDARVGQSVARALAGQGVGQSVAVKAGAVVAVEAIEGTDEMIARAGALAGGGVTVVKVARPHQDRRFDLPAIGPGTIEAMRAAGATGLAVEAGSTLVVARARTIEAADRAGIAIWGLAPERARDRA